jgi:hypothetical protein
MLQMRPAAAAAALLRICCEECMLERREVTISTEKIRPISSNLFASSLLPTATSDDMTLTVHSIQKTAEQQNPRLPLAAPKLRYKTKISRTSDTAVRRARLI